MMMHPPYGEVKSGGQTASQRPTACDLDQIFTLISNLQSPCIASWISLDIIRKLTSKWDCLAAGILLFSYHFHGF